ncbi:MAG: hypothetical protein ABEJ24_01630 [Candidatus Magasanikbacteria bacterium]
MLIVLELIGFILFIVLLYIMIFGDFEKIDESEKARMREFDASSEKHIRDKEMLSEFFECQVKKLKGTVDKNYWVIIVLVGLFISWMSVGVISRSGLYLTSSLIVGLVLAHKGYCLVKSMVELEKIKYQKKQIIMRLERIEAREGLSGIEITTA